MQKTKNALWNEKSASIGPATLDIRFECPVSFEIKFLGR